MIYTIIALLLCGTDECIKRYVEEYRRAGENLPAIHNKIILKKYHNTGAMLNLGDKKQKVMAMISVIFTVFMSGVFVATLGFKGKALLKTGLALLLGGAFSNTYDRLYRKYVVDYFSFNTKNKKIRNIVFNISDFGIIIGSFLMVLSEQFAK